ncbi:MAG: VOC family protein [Nocardioidaceae bacterium]
MSDSVVHFEIPADDLERAHTFYRHTFGWDVQHMPEMQYSMLTTTETGDAGPVNPGSINGGMFKRDDEMKAPTVVIGVDDIDKALEKVSAAGGSTVRDKMQVGDMGWAGYFKDTEGNLIGLWQNAT